MIGRYSDYLLVSDFDLTLTDTNHQVHPKNVEAINSFIEQGGAFTVATGRARKAFEGMLDKVPVNAPMIYSNGSITYDHVTDSILELHEMPPEADRILKLIMDDFPDVGMEMYQIDDEVCVINPNNEIYRHMKLVNLTPLFLPVDKIARPWVKVVLAADFEPLQRACQRINTEFADYFYAVVSLPFLMDIQAKGVSKGRAARSLLKRLGRKTLVCVGDAENDLAMLEEADMTFVPENSHPNVLKLGYNVVCHCDEGSLAEVIAKL